MNCIYSIVAWFKKNSYILLEEQNNSVMFFLNSKVQFKMADHEILQEILDTILDFLLRKHGTQRHFIPWGFSTFNWLPNLSPNIWWACKVLWFNIGQILVDMWVMFLLICSREKEDRVTHCCETFWDIVASILVLSSVRFVAFLCPCNGSCISAVNVGDCVSSKQGQQNNVCQTNLPIFGKK